MIRSTVDFRAMVKAARRVGTPLVAVRTADPASAIANVSDSVNTKKGETPLVVWDFVSGILGRNDAGKSAVAKIVGENSSALGPGDVLAMAQRLAGDTVLFLLNPHRVWEQPDVLQGIWNLRDVFKEGGQMLVLVTPPGSILPVELQNDVMTIDEPLPSAADLDQLLLATFESAKLREPDGETRQRAIDALIGLAAFPAEQALAMSLSKAGLDLGLLWDRKRQATVHGQRAVCNGSTAEQPEPAFSPTATHGT